MRIFLLILGSLLLAGGVAFLIWPGPRRARAWMKRIDERSAWARRDEERQVEQLRRWEARPTRYWFVPVILAVVVAVVLVWMIVALDWRVSGPAGGSVIGALLLYGFARKPGSKPSEHRDRDEMRRAAVVIGGATMLVGGVAALLAAFDAVD